MAAVLVGRAFCGFPGVLLSRWPLRACCYRRGSAAAARSRATDPAASRAEPAAILGLRRCTARAARRTLYAAFGASVAIASTVSRRGWRRRHGTPMTIPATGRQGRARGSTAIAGGPWVFPSRREPGPVCQACASGQFAAGCSLAPRPRSALPCQGPTPPARSQQRLSTLPGPAAGGRCRAWSRNFAVSGHTASRHPRTWHASGPAGVPPPAVPGTFVSSLR
jgi:hypothetical protein